MFKKIAITITFSLLIIISLQVAIEKYRTENATPGLYIQCKQSKEKTIDVILFEDGSLARMRPCHNSLSFNKIRTGTPIAIIAGPPAETFIPWIDVYWWRITEKNHSYEISEKTVQDLTQIQLVVVE